jgi:kynurenine 3-monooxygenase
MPNDAQTPSVVIVGAGMAGTLMAIYLGRRNFNVQVFERRADVRIRPSDRGRSINMTLAARGLHALEQAGLLDQVLALTIPLDGRMVHSEDGRASFQAYGQRPGEIHHSFKRTQLNILLMNAAEAVPNVSISFRQRCVHVTRETGTAHFQDELTGEMTFVSADVIIGADGAHSSVRQQIQRGQMAGYEQSFLGEGYCELTIPAGPNGTFQLDRRSLHVWPRGDCVLIAIPNADGSFTCTCTIPFEGPVSFQRLRTAESVRAFFERDFPDVLALAPGIVDEFMAHPASPYMTTHTSTWHDRRRVVLIGDACHCVVPFYGQGMNAALEDCYVLDRCIDEYPGDWPAIFAEYQRRRKPNTDALADLSRDNYIELKERVRSPVFRARRTLELLLARWFPRACVPLYSLISHTTVPYAEAVARHARRQRLWTWCGLNALLTLVAIPYAGIAQLRSSLVSRRIARQRARWRGVPVPGTITEARHARGAH